MKKSFGRVIIEAFCDDKGLGSMIRLCTLLLITGGLLIIAFTDRAEYGIAVIGIGITGKVAQKRMSERKPQSE